MSTKDRPDPCSQGEAVWPSSGVPLGETARWPVRVPGDGSLPALAPARPPSSACELRLGWRGNINKNGEQEKGLAGHNEGDHVTCPDRNGPSSGCPKPKLRI